MSEEYTPENELEMLKERAKILGINPGNRGVEKLREAVNAKMNGEEIEQEEAPVEAAAATSPAERPKTKAQIEQEIREKLQKEQMALVRCRIYNLNPSKRDLQGEIITVANKYMGTVRKFIPFGEATDNGYHIERCIYNDLKSRKFQQINTKRVKGQIQIDNRVVPEYNIEVMPMLNEKELAELAARQSAAERLGA